MDPRKLRPMMVRVSIVTISAVEAEMAPQSKPQETRQFGIKTSDGTIYIKDQSGTLIRVIKDDGSKPIPPVHVLGRVLGQLFGFH